MGKVLKVLAGMIALVFAGVGAFVAYVLATWDKDYSGVERPAIAASTDPAVVARGEYIAHSVSHCSICHVPFETTVKRKPGEHPPMAGGFEWKMGPMGTLHSRNITPDAETGIGSWTDGELARAIRYGVGKDGKLLPFMSMAVPDMADEDLTAVVSYLRSTAPVKQPNRPHDLGLLMKWLATKMGPDWRKQVLKPNPYVAAGDTPSVARGKYLAYGPGWCIACHTGFDLMEVKLTGPEFGGNTEAEPDMEDPTMEYVTPNLTPDAETGHIASWSEEQFVQRFRAGRVLRTSKMPWEAYREMTDADLRSVYQFLRTLPPAKNKVGPTHRKAG